MLKSLSDLLLASVGCSFLADPTTREPISCNALAAFNTAKISPVISSKFNIRSYRRSLFILVLFLGPTMAFAQHSKPDSLRDELVAARTNQDKLAGLIALMNYYYEDNRDSALYYVEKAMPIAKKSDMLLYAAILDSKGYQLMREGKFPKSFICLQEALEIAANPQYEKSTLFYLRFKGFTAHKARLDVVASIHQHLGHLLGNTNYFRGQIDQYRQAKQYSQQAGNTARLGNLNMSLGKVYITLNRLDSAMIFEKKAETLFKQNGGDPYLTNVYLNLAAIFSKKGDKVAELKYVRRALNNGGKLNINARRISSYTYLSGYYITAKHADSALYYAKRALAALQVEHSHNFNSVNDLFYKAYRLKGNIDSAYKYQSLVLTGNDSTYNSTIKNLSDFQQLAFKDQLRLRDIEKQKELDETKNRTYILFAVVGVFLLLTLIFYRNYLQKQKANKLLNQQKQEIESQRDDLTEALAELKSAQQQLIQSEKMASLGELTAGIAHEIQNPLNFVNNFSEVNTELIDEMQQEIEKGDYEEVKAIASDIKDNQQKISQHGKRADFIVKGMLQHSRTSTGERQLTNVNVLADEFFKLSFHGLRAKDKSFNAVLTTHFDDTLPQVNIVQQDIGRVLLNLFNNSFYAVNEKVTMAGDDYKPEVTVSSSLENNKVIIKVRDNGMGIPDAIKEKIMQPFFTTKPAGEGTGLGLSLSYDIVVKGHGGRIEIDTKVNEYTAMIIHLPI